MRWAALWQGILAGLSYFAAGLTLLGTINHTTTGVVVLAIGALQAGTAAYYAFKPPNVIAPSPPPSSPLIVPPGSLAPQETRPIKP